MFLASRTAHATVRSTAGLTLGLHRGSLATKSCDHWALQGEASVSNGGVCNDPYCSWASFSGLSMRDWSNHNPIPFGWSISLPPNMKQVAVRSFGYVQPPCVQTEQLTIFYLGQGKTELQAPPTSIAATLARFARPPSERSGRKALVRLEESKARGSWQL